MRAGLLGPAKYYRADSALAVDPGRCAWKHGGICEAAKVFMSVNKRNKHGNLGREKMTYSGNQNNRKVVYNAKPNRATL